MRRNTTRCRFVMAPQCKRGFLPSTPLSLQRAPFHYSAGPVFSLAVTRAHSAHPLLPPHTSPPSAPTLATISLPSEPAASTAHLPIQCNNAFYPTFQLNRIQIFTVLAQTQLDTARPSSNLARTPYPLFSCLFDVAPATGLLPQQRARLARLPGCHEGLSGLHASSQAIRSQEGLTIPAAYQTYAPSLSGGPWEPTAVRSSLWGDKTPLPPPPGGKV